MPHCPICKSAVNDVVHDKEVDVRGKMYRHEVCYCPSCGVKFTFFTPLGEEAKVQES